MTSRLTDPVKLCLLPLLMSACSGTRPPAGAPPPPLADDVRAEFLAYASAVRESNDVYFGEWELRNMQNQLLRTALPEPATKRLRPLWS